MIHFLVATPLLRQTSDIVHDAVSRRSIERWTYSMNSDTDAFVIGTEVTTFSLDRAINSALISIKQIDKSEIAAAKSHRGCPFVRSRMT